MTISSKYKIGFIVGSPRSGTTLLGDILDLQTQISRWYEPYFVIDHHFRNAPNDVLIAKDATLQIKEYIRDSFNYYYGKIGCEWIIDKSPRNSLKIPFLLEIFPSAKFIHLVRDGRDAVLSINHEWRRREELIGNQKQPLETFKVVWRFANRQILWRNKLAALRFESGGIRDRLFRKPFLHKIRWKGRVGWGPRFDGWQNIIDTISLLEFNAEQWIQCVDSVLEHKPLINPGNYYTIRYEDLLQDPGGQLDQLTAFLGVNNDGNLIHRIPKLNRNNFGKWKSAFSGEDLAEIGPRISPTLRRLNYIRDDSWYSQGTR